MGDTIFKLLVVSAVVMGISHTITKERIFERVRAALGGKDTFWGYLFSCPYCASHWVAFLVVPVTDTYFVSISPAWGAASPVLSWFFSSILVTVVAAFLRVVFYFIDETQGLVRRREKAVDRALSSGRIATRGGDELPRARAHAREPERS